MSIPLVHIIKNVNRIFRHNFPLPQAPEDSYIQFQTICQKCSSSIFVSNIRFGSFYSVYINDIQIDAFEFKCWNEKDFQNVLCKKLAAFL